jgi:hypothetical protein
MKGSARLGGAVLALALGLSPLAVAAPASASGTEGRFIEMINSSRANAGLPALKTRSDLSSYADGHTAKMMTKGTIFHSSDSQMRNMTTGWSLLGENVGMGPVDVGILHEAFMDSPSHRANILGDFSYLGVGAAVGEDGYLYVTVEFMRPQKATAGARKATTQSPPIPAEPDRPRRLIPAMWGLACSAAPVPFCAI